MTLQNNKLTSDYLTVIVSRRPNRPEPVSSHYSIQGVYESCPYPLQKDKGLHRLTRLLRETMIIGSDYGLKTRTKTKVGTY